jgi:hypothetical protein
VCAKLGCKEVKMEAFNSKMALWLGFDSKVFILMTIEDENSHIGLGSILVAFDVFIELP